MLRYAQHGLLLAASAALLSCASPKMGQELEGGKLAFKSGDYKQAFHQLLPVAASGRPEGQYAVGYMYYYGLGIARDEESGIFWMEKSAQQHYAPAITALEMIHHPVVHSENTAPSQVAMNTQDAVLNSLSTPPAAAKQTPVLAENDDEDDDEDKSPIKSAVAPKPKNTSHPVLKKQLAKTDFTVQLFGAYQVAAVKDLQKKFYFKNSTYIWHTSHNGKDWYVLTYGKFETPHQAALAKNIMHEKVNDIAPWVRKMDGLQLMKDIPQRSHVVVA